MFKFVPALFAAALACAPLVVRAQDAPLTPAALQKALDARPDNASAAKLAQRLRAMAGAQDLTKGMRPAADFSADAALPTESVGPRDALVAFAIESPSGVPTAQARTGDVVRGVILSRLGDTNVYAGTLRYTNVNAGPFPTGVGMVYTYSIDGKPVERRRNGGSDDNFEAYAPNPETQTDPAVPKGVLTKQANWKSKIFPDTDREWWVYVPAQYKPENPACVMIFQDGAGYREAVSRIADRLIAKGEMPVTVGIFIQPGNLPPGQTAPGNRGERNFEYDTRSDQYARFLLEEVLPEVEKTVKLRHDAPSRMVAGLSSGSTAAFGCAWYRPDQFGKVLSWIGSFTDLSPGESGIEGAHNYPFLIRRLPNDDPRLKMRVFLQDGANDLDNPFGNWPLANQTMAKALAFKHVDYKFVFGGGFHSGNHGNAILPETLRWMWRKE